MPHNDSIQQIKNTEGKNTEGKEKNSARREGLVWQEEEIKGRRVEDDKIRCEMTVR